MKRIFLFLLILQSTNLLSVATINPCERLTFGYEDDPKYRYYPDTVLSNIVDDASFYSMYPYYSYYSY